MKNLETWEIVKIVIECDIAEPMPIFFPEFVARQATRT